MLIDFCQKHRKYTFIIISPCKTLLIDLKFFLNILVKKLIGIFKLTSVDKKPILSKVVWISENEMKKKHLDDMLCNIY